MLRRLHATASANSSNEPHQDRHLMTASPTPAAKRPTIFQARRDPPLIPQPLNRRPTRCIGSIQINEFTPGTQIPITPAARPYVPSSAVSSLGGFRTPAAQYAAPSFKRPASKTLHKSAVLTACRSLPVFPYQRTSPGAVGMSQRCHMRTPRGSKQADMPRTRAKEFPYRRKAKSVWIGASC
jgi:hypothetical protein